MLKTIFGRLLEPSGAALDTFLVVLRRKPNENQVFTQKGKILDIGGQLSALKILVKGQNPAKCHIRRKNATITQNACWIEKFLETSVNNVTHCSQERGL